MRKSMKRKTKSAKKGPAKKSELETNVTFRVRTMREIKVDGLDHPLPIPGYKSTLPGAPGWWAKESPGV